MSPRDLRFWQEPSQVTQGWLGQGVTLSETLTVTLSTSCLKVFESYLATRLKAPQGVDPKEHTTPETMSGKGQAEVLSSQKSLRKMFEDSDFLQRASMKAKLYTNPDRVYSFGSTMVCHVTSWYTVGTL